MISNNLFLDEMEQIAIDRIQRFARLAGKMDFEVCLGFSGGKDSQVVHHLCKRANITFKAFFNHCFESNVTRQFIREHYPDVIYRRVVKEGFIRNIAKNHHGFLPTAYAAYCCEDYKHNPKAVDEASITGVRRAESAKRATRTTMSVKNKTTARKNRMLINEYFQENCQSTGTASVIQLLPIVDWTDSDVWSYIHKYNLPVNPEYKYSKRVGCIVCPKKNFSSNYRMLLKHPKLIDAFIRAKEKGFPDYRIKKDGSNLANNKCLYICRWLNHSFMPFTKKQEQYYKLVEQKYNEYHNKHRRTGQTDSQKTD